MHRFRRALVLVVSGAVIFGGGSAAAHATTPTNLRVDNTSASCTDTGSGAGSIATPFCTIQAAANAAVPGDNVDIDPGTYVGAVDIRSRGTASAWIDFLPGGTGPVVISLGAGQSGPALSLDGASYVGFYGSDTMVTYPPYYWVPDISVASVLVTGSSHITLEGISSTSATTDSAVDVTGSSSAVSLIDSALSGQGGGVLVESGGSGDIISSNSISSQSLGIEVDGSSNTVIGSNTLWGQSTADDQIAVADSSTGTSIENNVVAYPETVAGVGAAISVDNASAAGTTEDYNVVWPDEQGTSTVLESAYSWSGTDYASQAAYTAATTQGEHDVVADPQLQADSPFSDSATAPQFGSANYAAPDWQTRDFSGSDCGGDPYVIATGVGSEADCARGAVQQAFSIQLSDESPTAVGATGVKMTTSVFGEVFLKGSWVRLVAESTPAVSQTLAWGDGSTSTVSPDSVNVETTNSHTYAKPGVYTITETVGTVGAGDVTGSWPFTTSAVPAGALFTLNHTAGGEWGGGTIPLDSTGIANVAITGMPDGSTQMVAVTTAGTVEHVVYGNMGVQQGWRTPGQPGAAVESVSIAGMPNGSSQLIAVTSAGTLVHTVRNANGSWQSGWGSPAGSAGIAQAAITAMPNGSSQLVAITTNGTLEHDIRNANGSWQGWRSLTQPGVTVTDASIAGMPNGSSQIIEITSTGLLKHDIRNADGSWQASGWGSPTGSTGIAQASITAMPNGDSQLAAVTTSGVLEYDIRHANGSWPSTGWTDTPQIAPFAAVAGTGISGMPDGSSQIIELSAN